MAYFTGEADLTEARFVAGKVKTAFECAPKLDAKTGAVDNRRIAWSICNTGDNDVYLRVKPICEISQAVLEDDEAIAFGAVEGTWKRGKDDYYYYPYIIEPNESVVFPLKITFELWYSVDLPVDIVAEAVQASNNAISEVWPDNPFTYNP